MPNKLRMWHGKNILKASKSNKILNPISLCILTAVYAVKQFCKCAMLACSCDLLPEVNIYISMLNILMFLMIQTSEIQLVM